MLRRKRLRDGDREVKGVLFLSTSLLQNEHLLVQDLLAVHVLSRKERGLDNWAGRLLSVSAATPGLHEDPEWLGPTVHLGVPLEVRGDGELHHEAGALRNSGVSDVLGVNRQGSSRFWERELLDLKA